MAIISPTALGPRPNPATDEIIRDTLRRRETHYAEAWRGPNSWLSRFTQGCLFVSPVIAELFPDKSNLRVLEIGCGQGQKALSYAAHVDSVFGVDLNPGYIETARKAAAKMGVGNASFAHVAAADMGRVLAGDRFKIVMLYAVLEHLTPVERLDLLAAIWSHLDDDGFVFIGETPNRVSVFDAHSLHLHFVDTLPDELYLKYASLFSPRTDSLEGAKILSDDPLIGSYRVGRGVSFHEFELALGTRFAPAGHVVYDSFRVFSRNLYPLQRYECSLLDMMRWHGNCIPQIFSRYWIEGVLSKRAESKPLDFAVAETREKDASLDGYDAYGMPTWLLREGNEISAYVEAQFYQVVIDTACSHGVVAIKIDGSVHEEIVVQDLKVSAEPDWRYVVLERQFPAGQHRITVSCKEGHATVGEIGTLGAPPRPVHDPRAPRVLSPELVEDFLARAT